MTSNVIGKLSLQIQLAWHGVDRKYAINLKDSIWAGMLFCFWYNHICVSITVNSIMSICHLIWLCIIFIKKKVHSNRLSFKYSFQKCAFYLEKQQLKNMHMVLRGHHFLWNRGVMNFRSASVIFLWPSLFDDQKLYEPPSRPTMLKEHIP